MFRTVFIVLFATIGGQALILHQLILATIVILIGASLLAWRPRAR